VVKCGEETPRFSADKNMPRSGDFSVENRHSDAISRGPWQSALPTGRTGKVVPIQTGSFGASVRLALDPMEFVILK
jgi:hypothetical protein